MGTSAPVAPLNLILATLPPDELELLLNQATTVTLELRQVMFEPNDPIDNVYFPLTGLGSLVTVLMDGTSLEAMTVGREGFIGLPVFTEFDQAEHDACARFGVTFSRFRRVGAAGSDLAPVRSREDQRHGRTEKQSVRVLRDDSGIEARNARLKLCASVQTVRCKSLPLQVLRCFVPHIIVLRRSTKFGSSLGDNTHGGHVAA
jgi:hypothetical protein